MQQQVSVPKGESSSLSGQRSQGLRWPEPGSCITESARGDRISEVDGTRGSDKSDCPDGTLSPDSTSVMQFARLAELLDSAGLGPADYLYSSLKWRLQKPEVRHFSLWPSLFKAFRLALSNPPPVPQGLHGAVILAASSYIVSANLLGQVVAALKPGEGVLCNVSGITPLSLSSRLVDGFRSLLAIIPALIFTVRVRSTLIKDGVGLVECNRIAMAAFIHSIYRRTARAILKKVEPRCLVIGNGNRPFEFSLWAEARTRGIATVLLPYAEISPKPARFLSLCRGKFDLVLPLSDYSADQLRKLRPDVAVEVVGFPANFCTVDTNGGLVKKNSYCEVLYIAGNNFEAAAAELLREAFVGCHELRLRVRLHPRNRGVGARRLFDWLDQDQIKDPMDTKLAEDIGSSDVVLTVRSTAALDAMVGGVPLVWLSPKMASEELERYSLREQKLALLEASTCNELRTIIQRLYNDGDERKRVVEEQWSRLRAAGYDRDYFQLVKNALRQMIGVDAANGAFDD